MKVLSKILGAIVLLGCLAYISFVFGKYVLSSTMLKSVPQQQRVISDASAPAPAVTSEQRPSGPRVEMRVMPDATPRRRRNHSRVRTDSRTTSAEEETSNNQMDSDRPRSREEETVKKPEEDEDNEKIISSAKPEKAPEPEKKQKPKETTGSPKASEQSASKPVKTDNNAPVRLLDPADSDIEKSPVPKPEKSTFPSNNGDSANISPIPRPE